MPDLIPTGLACPSCEREGKGEQPLFNAIGASGSFCQGNTHKFNDMAELLAMNPKRIIVPQAPKPPDPNEVSVTFKMPAKLRDALMLRFGEKLGPTAIFVFQELLSFNSFIVSGMDASRLKEHLHQEVQNSTHLVGAVYAMRQQLIQANNDLETLRSTRGSGKGLQVELSVETLMQVADKAKFNNMSVDQMAATIIETGLKNQWV